MRTIYLCLAVIVTAWHTTINAQETRQDAIKKFAEIPDYRIGDQLPDFGDLKIINADQSTINLADFNDRLLILDFWNKGCSACIAYMPHMDALQKEFGEKIKILPIAEEDRQVMEDLWKNNRKLKALGLTSIVEAKNVFDYFAHIGDPYEVWIYKGKVIGITNPEYVDAFNVNQVLSGTIPNWQVRNDYYQFDVVHKPLFTTAQTQTADFSKDDEYARISGYREVNGIAVHSPRIENQGIVRDTNQKTVRTVILNQGIYNIYSQYWGSFLGSKGLGQLVVPEQFTVSPNSVIWEVADRSKYVYDYVYEPKPGFYQGDWLRKNGFCFESLYADHGETDQQIYQRAIADLNRLLGLNVRWEKRKEKVLILVRTTKEDKIKGKIAPVYNTQNKSWSFDQYVQKGNLHQLRYGRLGMITHFMNQQASNPYVFDETGYEGNVDMDLDVESWTDIAGIRKALKPYGLDLKEEERLVDKFVFSEVGSRIGN